VVRKGAFEDMGNFAVAHHLYLLSVLVFVPVFILFKLVKIMISGR
jgi:hypothetical protein